MTEAELLGLADNIKPETGMEIDFDPDRQLRYFKNETVITVVAMHLRQMSLFAEMIQGGIDGYRVEVNRGVDPTEFHITTWT